MARGAARCTMRWVAAQPPVAAEAWALPCGAWVGCFCGPLRAHVLCPQTLPWLAMHARMSPPCAHPPPPRICSQVAYNRPPAVQALLDNGADTSARDNTGNPPLHYAAGCAQGSRGWQGGREKQAGGWSFRWQTNHPQMCAARLAQPPLSPSHSLHLRPPLSYGREECVRLLLAAGADVAAKNDKGQTAAEVRLQRSAQTRSAFARCAQAAGGGGEPGLVAALCRPCIHACCPRLCCASARLLPRLRALSTCPTVTLAPALPAGGAGRAAQPAEPGRGPDGGAGGQRSAGIHPVRRPV